MLICQDHCTNHKCFSYLFCAALTACICQTCDVQDDSTPGLPSLLSQISQTDNFTICLLSAAGTLDNITNLLTGLQMSHDAGTPEVDSAAEVAEDLPRRSPLTQRGLTKQQWAELQQQQQQAAVKPPRKPLTFQYPAGMPPCSCHCTLRQLMPPALCLPSCKAQGMLSCLACHTEMSAWYKLPVKL